MYVVVITVVLHIMVCLVYIPLTISDCHKMLQEVLEKEPVVQVQTQYVPLFVEEAVTTTKPIELEPIITTEIEVETEEKIETVAQSETELKAETVSTTTTSTETTIGKVIGEDVTLPNLPTDRKVYTDYRMYNIPGTPHNRMQQLACTDELGCRRYNDYYIVGLGSAYADRVGETFEVELETGIIFKIITGDMKADSDTDPTNRYAPCLSYYHKGECANILEFIVDKNVLNPKACSWGGVDWYDNFKGDIVRMTYLGRDKSADWDTYF